MTAIAGIGTGNVQPYFPMPSRLENMELHIVPAQFDLEITPMQININLRATYNSMGLRDNVSFAQSVTQDAQQTFMQGLERRVQQGDEMAAPKSPSVAQIVSRDLVPKPSKQLGLALTPPVPPQVSGTPGTIKETYVPGSITVTLVPGASGIDINA
jgi:hypothetical protein